MLDGVARVLKLNTLGDEALAAFLAAAADDVTAGVGRHAGAETELGFAGALGGLISAFAHGGNLSGGSSDRFLQRRGGRTLGFGGVMSTRQ